MERAVRIRAMGALAALLVAEGRELERPLPHGATTKSLAEGVGVPHTEIDGLCLDGRWGGFEAHPEPGSLLELHPWATPRRVPPHARLLREHAEAPSFVADVHLGSLMRRLRLAGFDVRFDPAMDDAALARTSAEEDRVVLTRDRKLLMRKVVERGCLVLAEGLDAQLAQVFCRFELSRFIRPLTRCVRCNGAIVRVEKQAVEARLEPGTRREFDEFYACADCGRVYWKGAHYRSLVTLVDRLRGLG
jgi:uncharacterized protein